MAKQDMMQSMEGMGGRENALPRYVHYGPNWGGGERGMQGEMGPTGPPQATPQQQTPAGGQGGLVQPSMTAMDFINNILMQYGRPGVARPSTTGSVSSYS